MKTKLIGLFALALAFCCVPCLAYAEDGSNEGDPILLTEINLIVDEPVVGEKIDTSTWSVETKPAAGIDVVDQTKNIYFERRSWTTRTNPCGWLSPGEAGTPTEYQAGRCYSAELSFWLKEGYTVSQEQTALYVNGKPATMVPTEEQMSDPDFFWDDWHPVSFISEEGDSVGIVYLWGTPTPIKTIDLQVTEPVAGEHPDFSWSVFTDPEGAIDAECTEGSHPQWVRQYVENGETKFELLTEESVFQPRETYVFADLIMYPCNEYCIPEKYTTGLVNGKALPEGSFFRPGETDAYFAVVWTLPCSHSWSDWVVTTEPTYESEGEETRTCEICDETETRPVGKLIRTNISDCAVMLSETSFTYSAQQKKPVVTVVDPAGNALVEGTDFTVAYKNNTYVGKATVTVTGINGCEGTTSKNFTINPLSLSAAGAKMTLSTTVYTYNGQAKKPAVTVVGTVGGASKTLCNARRSETGTAINISYPVGRMNVGSYTVTAIGTGNYTGTLTKTFTVKPGNAYVKGLYPGKSTLTWTATSKPAYKGATKYQVQVKRQGASKWDYSFTSSTYTGKIGTSIKLAKGQRYYVKLRAVKTVGDKTYYGAWSKPVLSGKIK